MLRVFSVVALFGALLTFVACGDSGESGGGAPGWYRRGSCREATLVQRAVTPPEAAAAGGDSGSGGSAGTGSGGGPIGTGGASTCTPKTCADLDVACGYRARRLRTVFRCGTCTAGNICDSATHRCVKKSDACTAINAECGLISDACGNPIDCGSCPAGEVCDGATHQCAPCRPKTCAETGCGTMSDGCGGTLTCGACGSGLACDFATQTCEPCHQPPPVRPRRSSAARSATAAARV